MRFGRFGKLHSGVIFSRIAIKTKSVIRRVLFSVKVCAISLVHSALLLKQLLLTWCTHH